MTKKSKTVLFFGSGPVAARCLELLVKHTQVEAVITKPKPEHHRGNFPVIETANQLGLKIFFVTNKAELSQLIDQKSVNSELAVLIDFGIIVSQDVIDYFPLGIVNSHFSLLPQWRGADPITFSILSGQSETGVSLMLINAAMDEGELLAQESIAIDPTATSTSLTSDLIDLSDGLLDDMLEKYINGEIKPYPQDESRVSYSRKLTKNDGRIDWHKPAVQLEREIRAYQQWPKSYTTLAGKDITVLKASVTDRTGSVGSIIEKSKELIIACGEQALAIETLKPAGGSAMNAQAFLAGYKDRL